jgi:hypothetical protein
MKFPARACLIHSRSALRKGRKEGNGGREGKKGRGRKEGTTEGERGVRACQVHARANIFYARARTRTCLYTHTHAHARRCTHVHTTHADARMHARARARVHLFTNRRHGFLTPFLPACLSFFLSSLLVFRRFRTCRKRGYKAKGSRTPRASWR